MFNKLKQFKDLRNQAKTLQSALAEETVEAEKGGVKIIMNGNQEITSVTVSPELLSPNKKQEIESAIKDANSAAIDKAKRVMAKKMQSMGGLDQFGMGNKQ
ncbi:MAG: YbaB/EbfC family nucleoid-associated protein [Patescibacteria group bacterium]|nr:YbaB/EbfC family nucleoid-associated protein [bacterium]MDZ4221389.1 YbaB/EbfC family nucleoid-associated protein [Patescibacteria group bacterium]